MRFHWPRILLLSTFVFWATGAAKYTHEALEHHGRDASVDDGDDDDDAALVDHTAELPARLATSPAPASHIPAPASHIPAHPPEKHPCQVCQMLAAMVVDRSAPPALPPRFLRLISTIVVPDHIAPVSEIGHVRFARGPPMLICQ